MSFFGNDRTGQRCYYDAPSQQWIKVGPVLSNATPTSSGGRTSAQQAATTTSADTWMLNALRARENAWDEVASVFIRDIQAGQDLINGEGYTIANVRESLLEMARKEFYTRYLNDTAEQHRAMCASGSVAPGTDFSVDEIEIHLDPAVEWPQYREFRTTGVYTLTVGGITKERESTASLFRRKDARR